MLFNSFEFLIFFPLVTLVYFVIPRKVRYLWLLLASYYFYMCWSAKYALLLLFSTCITYLSGILMERIKTSGRSEENKQKAKKWVVAGSVILNLGMLGYFKYTNFLVDVVNRVTDAAGLHLNIPAFDIVLPVGISFYIFQALGYTVDVYRDDIYAEKNFFRYALFVSFFPQLVAGPIERSKNLLRQLAEPKDFDYNNVRDGLLIMLWGFFQKMVIADRAAVLVNNVYGNVEAYSGYQLVVASVLFCIQIYCDFMGYSTIAMGAARVMGYRLMENFKNPFFAVSVRDIWQRWHISLGSWFRDYLYFPLGGSRKGKLAKYRNIIIVFTVSGLWHGAAYTFVIWGLLQGVYQVLEEVLEPYVDRFVERFKIRTETFSWRVLRTLKTCFLFASAAVFFRADSVATAVTVLKKGLMLGNIGTILNGGLYELGLDERNVMLLLLALLVLFVWAVMRECKINVLQWIGKQNALFRYLLYWGAIVMIIFSLDTVGAEFIYFQF